MSTVKRHTLGPIARRSIPDAIKHVFQLASGEPRNLTGYDVTAYVERPDQETGTVRPAEMVDASEGSVRYVFEPDDLSAADQIPPNSATKLGTKVQFVAEHPTTGRRHVSDVAVLGVGDTPVSSEFDTP